MSEDKQVVLAIFAHPDDELSCAGTMANHVDAGDDVHLTFLTKGENVTSIEGTNEDRIAKRKKHTEQIEELLGVKVHFMDFPDSRIPISVEGAVKVAELIKEFQPDIILTWDESGGGGGFGVGHPDHRHTSKLVEDAITYARLRNPDSEFEPHRKFMNVFQYFNEVNNKLANPVYVDVSTQVDKIKEFVNVYQEAYGNYNLIPFIEMGLKLNGARSSTKFAERFYLRAGNIKPHLKLPPNPGFPIEKLDPDKE